MSFVRPVTGPGPVVVVTGAGSNGSVYMKMIFPDALNEAQKVNSRHA